MDDKGDKRKSVESKKSDKLPKEKEQKKDVAVMDDFFNVKEDPILSKQPDNHMKKEESNDDLFKNEFDDFDLE